MKFATGSSTAISNGIFVMVVSTAADAVVNMEFRTRYTDS